MAHLSEWSEVVNFLFDKIFEMFSNAPTFIKLSFLRSDAEFYLICLRLGALARVIVFMFKYWLCSRDYCLNLTSFIGLHLQQAVYPALANTLSSNIASI